MTSDFVIFMCLIQLLRSPSTFSSCATEGKKKKQKSKAAFTIHTAVEKTKAARGNVEKKTSYVGPEQAVNTPMMPYVLLSPALLLHLSDHTGLDRL